MISYLSKIRAALFNRRPTKPGAKGSLGTFIGVYTPTVLTILGVIMYLRFGWVVGHVGLLRALLIVLLANALTLVTALCFSAVATNSRVGVGGAYFIVSRSLGLEIGGAIGIPLFLSQALSVTLYAYGLAESLRFVWPGVPVQAAAFFIILLTGLLAFRGATEALRLQVPVMVLIALSLAALAAGGLINASPARLIDSAPSGEYGFWFVFAVFFPAVTGIMAGLSLSGDLADPKRSIPRGTILATLTGLGVYLVVPVLLTLGSDPADLRNEPLIWTRIALLGPWLILPGLWGAIFSSAVGSILGAPRTLQALALDRLAPRFLASSNTGGEPVAGLIVTMTIALAAVFLGDLNTVAEVVTMVFLTVYGTVNLVAALEKISGNPAWRPQMQVTCWLSLSGALGCFGVMVLINLPASLVAMAMVFCLWLLLRRHERREDWGDVRRDLYETIIRWALIRLSHRPMTARNWRPHILVFVSNIDRRLPLVRFGAWFSQNRGVVTACELVVGDLLKLDLKIHDRKRHIDELLRQEGIIAFGEVDVVAKIEEGIMAVAQANGIAGIESNTVILGWPDDLGRLTDFLRVIRPLAHLNQSLLIGRCDALTPLPQGKRRTIDVWWGGLQRNGDLMLLLAYLLSRNTEWRNASIRILSIASSPLIKEQTERFLAKLIPEIRIAAKIDVMLKREGVSIREMIHSESAGVDLVILGLASPEEGEEADYALQLAKLAEGLPSFFFVHNGSLFIGELVGS